MLSLLSFVLLATTSLVSAQSGSAKTTRYWDCCKPSCAWPGKASYSSTLQTCNRSDGVLSDQNAKSGCDGGEAFMCSDNAPFAVSDSLAYGTAASAVGSESATCGACYELTFTSTAIAGKKMIVQNINTGGDLSNAHFDIALPGGGLGIFDGCSPQFNVPSSTFGQRYGGISDKSGCASLPKIMQAGCEFRFGWFQNADNPNVTYKKVACPSALTARTGLKRSDDSGSSGSQPQQDAPAQTNTSRMTTSTKSASSSSTNAAAPTNGSSNSGTAAKWAQCGGKGYTGPTKCASGSTCKSSGEYYSQCI